MAAAKQAAGRAPGGSPAAKILKITGVVLVSVVALVACVASAEFGDSSMVVPGPDATQRADTVAVLSKAAEAQDICYGWELTSGAGLLVSEGSNLGDGVAVDSDPTRCPVWAKVVAQVTYTSSSSELEDYASTRVEMSPGFNGRIYGSDLQQFGLSPKVFIDEPGWAICRAAVSLPLLAAERGVASPAPVDSVAPTTAPSPLPAAGSDLWRDRRGYLLASVGLLLGTVLLVTIGLVERRHQRRRQHAGYLAGR